MRIPAQRPSVSPRPRRRPSARAIARLVAEGLVETRPGAGNFVRHARPAAPVDLGWQTAALGPARADTSAYGWTLRPTRCAPGVTRWSATSAATCRTTRSGRSRPVGSTSG